MKPHTGKADAHVHLDYVESFEILAGTATIEVDGRTITAGAGERVELPPGTPHRNPYNAGDSDLRLRHRASPGGPFVEAFVSSSLVFCVGPLTILGSLSDGLGLGAQQLLLKATLDGFAAIAFAASLGVGVMASALAVGVIQGSLTLVGVLIGDFLPAAHLAAITATGGLLLVGVGLRLLQIKSVPVGNLLPALVTAPLLVQLVVVLR